jgi:hypothetical protein
MSDFTKILLCIAGICAIAFVIVFVMFLTIFGRTEELRIQNDTDGRVLVQVGLSTAQVAPHTSAVLENEFDEDEPLYIYAPDFKVCDWDDARQRQPLLIDAAGTHCTDIRIE